MQIFNQLRTRFILGSLFFLLILTAAVILVVRDSLLFSASNMGEVGTQALVDLSTASLQEIAVREAKLIDHVVHHDPSDFTGLITRLNSIQLSPDTVAFILDSTGKSVAVSSDGGENLVKALLADGDPTPRGDPPAHTTPADYTDISLRMRAGYSGAEIIILDSEELVVAFAPLETPGWSLGIVEPVTNIATRAQPLTASMQSEASRILIATLLTIAYFSVLAIIGAVLVARTLTRPIQKLVAGTGRIAQGDLNVRVPIQSRDELGVLAESFNRMADSLQARDQELLEANQLAIENARLYEQARTLATVEERQRLARELHDSVTQSLYSLMLLAEASRRKALDNDISTSIENITRLGELAQQALKEMRLLVFQLRPSALEQTGLIEALQHRLDAVEKRAGVETEFIVDLVNDLPAVVEVELYRMAEEALNNSLKHADASSVTVTLKSDQHHINLRIADNGKGFDQPTTVDLGGLGLISIRERAEAIGGKAMVTSAPGQGTSVKVRIPIDNLSARL